MIEIKNGCPVMESYMCDIMFDQLNKFRNK